MRANFKLLLFWSLLVKQVFRHHRHLSLLLIYLASMALSILLTYLYNHCRTNHLHSRPIWSVVCGNLCGIPYHSYRILQSSTRPGRSCRRCRSRSTALNHRLAPQGAGLLPAPLSDVRGSKRRIACSQATIHSLSHTGSDRCSRTLSRSSPVQHQLLHRMNTLGASFALPQFSCLWICFVHRDRLQVSRSHRVHERRPACVLLTLGRRLVRPSTVVPLMSLAPNRRRRSLGPW